MLPTSVSSNFGISTLYLVVVETVRLARVEPLLPGALESDNIVGVHVRRDALEDGKSEIPGITLPK